MQDRGDINNGSRRSWRHIRGPRSARSSALILSNRPNATYRRLANTAPLVTGGSSGPSVYQRYVSADDAGFRYRQVMPSQPPGLNFQDFNPSSQPRRQQTLSCQTHSAQHNFGVVTTTGDAKVFVNDPNARVDVTAEYLDEPDEFYDEELEDEPDFYDWHADQSRILNNRRSQTDSHLERVHGPIVISGGTHHLGSVIVNGRVVRENGIAQTSESVPAYDRTTFADT